MILDNKESSDVENYEDKQYKKLRPTDRHNEKDRSQGWYNFLSWGELVNFCNGWVDHNGRMMIEVQAKTKPLHERHGYTSINSLYNELCWG